MNDEETRKIIDETLGAFDSVPCLNNPAKYTCNRMCPLFYETAGGLIKHAEINHTSIVTSASDIVSSVEKLDQIGLEDYQRAISSKGFSLRICPYYKK